MVAAREELGDLRRKIELEVGRVVLGLRNEVAVARAREATLADALKDIKEEVAQLNTAGIELRALEREAEASRTLLETFLLRSRETTSQVSFQEPDVAVLS